MSYAWSRSVARSVECCHFAINFNPSYYCSFPSPCTVHYTGALFAATTSAHGLDVPCAGPRASCVYFNTIAPLTHNSVVGCLGSHAYKRLTEAFSYLNVAWGFNHERNTSYLRNRFDGLQSPNQVTNLWLQRCVLQFGGCGPQLAIERRILCIILLVASICRCNATLFAFHHYLHPYRISCTLPHATKTLFYQST